MKKILFSLMAILLAVGLVGGGAFAYFFDVETSSGNVFQAGTIDLSAPVQEYAYLTDLKPCEYGLLVIELHNDGNNPMHVWKHLYGVVCDENGIIEPEQEWYDTYNAGVPKNDIDTVMTYSLYVQIWDGDILVVEYDIIDPAVDHLKISDVECNWIYLGVLYPCETMWVIQDYHLQPEVENWAQSDTMTFDIEFYAEQLNGPGPTPELPGYGR